MAGNAFGHKKFYELYVPAAQVVDPHRCIHQGHLRCPPTTDRQQFSLCSPEFGKPLGTGLGDQGFETHVDQRSLLLHACESGSFSQHVIFQDQCCSHAYTHASLICIRQGPTIAMSGPRPVARQVRTQLACRGSAVRSIAWLGFIISDSTCSDLIPVAFIGIGSRVD